MRAKTTQMNINWYVLAITESGFTMCDRQTDITRAFSWYTCCIFKTLGSAWNA